MLQASPPATARVRSVRIPTEDRTSTNSDIGFVGTNNDSPLHTYPKKTPNFLKRFNWKVLWESLIHRLKTLSLLFGIIWQKFFRSYPPFPPVKPLFINLIINILYVGFYFSTRKQKYRKYFIFIINKWSLSLGKVAAFTHTISYTIYRKNERIFSFNVCQ